MCPRVAHASDHIQLVRLILGQGRTGSHAAIWAPGDKANGIEWGDIIPAFGYSGISQDI